MTLRQVARHADMCNFGASPISGGANTNGGSTAFVSGVRYVIESRTLSIVS